MVQYNIFDGESDKISSSWRYIVIKHTLYTVLQSCDWLCVLRRRSTMSRVVQRRNCRLHDTSGFHSPTASAHPMLSCRLLSYLPVYYRTARASSTIIRLARYILYSSASRTLLSLKLLLRLPNNYSKLDRQSILSQCDLICGATS